MNSALLPRFARRAVDTAMADTPILVLQGARQVGKSTLATQVSLDHGGVFVSLDNYNTLRFIREDPVAFIEQRPHGELVVIDEAQRAPELVLPLKASVDRDRRPGRFLLTGSADLLRVKGVADSLAGRAETIEMLPLSQGELSKRAHPEDFIAWLLGQAMPQHRLTPLEPDTIVRGGFPEPRLRTESRSRAWFSSYVSRLADHDAKELHQGGYPDQLAALLRIIAAQPQSELVMSKIARSLGIAESTADAYLRLATTMRLVVRTPSWSQSPRGRVVRRPKVCLTDSGLAASLARFTAPMAASPGGREYFGALLEQFVTLELMKQASWSTCPFSLYHFRDRDGLEVDLIVETFDGHLIAIEVKSTRTLSSSLWANLVKFRDRFADRPITGVVLHAGDTSAVMHGWLYALPVTTLWEHPY